MGKGKVYSASFKAKVAMAALKENRSMSQLSSEFGVHTNQISSWKKQLQQGAVGIFDQKSEVQKAEEQEELVRRLYEQIGQLQYEANWLKKKAGGS